MYDWLRFPAAGVCTWRGRTFGRWTRHADWVCNLYGLFWIRVLGAGDVKLFCAIGAFMGKEVWNVLLYTCIFAGGLAVGKLAVILAKRRKMPFLSEAERTEGVRMHMSVPILLGYIAYVTGGVSIGI